MGTFCTLEKHVSMKPLDCFFRAVVNSGKVFLGGGYLKVILEDGP